MDQLALAAEKVRDLLAEARPRAPLVEAQVQVVGVDVVDDAKGFVEIDQPVQELEDAADRVFARLEAGGHVAQLEDRGHLLVQGAQRADRFLQVAGGLADALLQQVALAAQRLDQRSFSSAIRFFSTARPMTRSMSMTLSGLVSMS